MESERLANRTISLDCDTIYFSDILASFRALPPSTGACFYFRDEREDHKSKPIFSYIDLSSSSDSTIATIKEKVPISRNANTGAYAFQSAAILMKEVERIIDGAVGTKGEYYTSSVISSLIDGGIRFVGVHVDDFTCVGTPKQLVAFLEELKGGNAGWTTARMGKKGEFELPPQAQFQPLAAELARSGHDVRIIEDKVAKDVADFSKEIGWAMATADADSPPSPVPPSLPPKVILPAFHRARSFNSIVIKTRKNALENELMVVKSGPADLIRGEKIWYESLPPNLAKYAPALLPLSPPQEATIALELIDGVTFSKVRGESHEKRSESKSITPPSYITNNLPLTASLLTAACSSQLLLNKCLTPKRLSLLFMALREFHSNPSAPSSPNTPPSDTLYKNYADKVMQRYKSSTSLYTLIDPGAEHLLSFLIYNLNHYEVTQSHRFVNLIHGDPVFTNILLTRMSTIKMVDPRGTLGSVEAVCGDQMYDFTKVYQSLSGYDHILAGVKPDEEYLKGLKEHFWKETDTYALDKAYINIITASHFFSIIPLHQEEQHRRAFLEIAEYLVGADYQEFKENAL